MKTFSRIFFTGFLCICLSLALFPPQSAAAEQELPKLLTTTSTTPVALMDVGMITAATSTGGCYISAYNWFDTTTGAALTGSFGTQNYRVEIQVSTYEGFYFSNNVDVYLNNLPAQYVLDAGQRVLTLYRDYSPDVWAPTVIKNPGGETVDEGGFASFVATAAYANAYSWSLSSPDGSQTISCDDLYSAFPGVTTSVNGTEKMNIRNIPADMDGWRIRCTFSGPGGDVNSGYAVINVKYETPPPAPTPTATPEPTASAEPESSPTPSPEVSPGEEHTHQFGEVWQYDDGAHWKQCQCGEKTQKAAHTMVWTTVEKATKSAPGSQEGRCSVCGYSTSRSVDYAPGEGGVARYAVWGVGALAAITVVVLIIDSIAKSRRRRRRRRRRR